MAIAHLEFLPILLVVLALIAFFTSYGMAVIRDHVDSFWPFISDAGARAPESCYFGQFLNLCAVVAFLGMLIRYKHVTTYKNISEMRAVECVNIVALVFTVLSCLGMSMVANFQMVNSQIPHFIGSIMVFGFAMLYCWCHSFISYKAQALGMSSKLSTATRTILSLAATVFFIICSFCTPYSLYQRRHHSHSGKATVNATEVHTPRPHHWDEDTGGYRHHLASSFSEWLLAFTVLLFSLTYFNEFRKISLSIKTMPREVEI